MKYPAFDHAARTFASLRALLPSSERDHAQVIVLAGAPTPYRHDTDREMPHRQESNFMYLSGCPVPGSYLLLLSAPGAHSEIDLFVPEISEADIMWSVPPPTAAAAAKAYPATRVAHAPDLPARLAAVLHAHTGALVHTLPRGSPLFPPLDEALLAPALAAGVTDAWLLAALHRTRLVKSAYEIAQIREANRISSAAHEVVMRVLALGGKKEKEGEEGKGKVEVPGAWRIESEGEAEAVFVAACRREGAVHQAYLPIVAASTRAATLHYCCNDKAFAWGPLPSLPSVSPSSTRDGVRSMIHSVRPLNGDAGNGHTVAGREVQPQVLLIDAGCEWRCYASDITRTMPVGNGGKFTPEAREIYSLVRAMQDAAFALVKPGTHWDRVHLACHHALAHGFLRLGVFKSDHSPVDILRSGVTSAFFPHGVGHSLGLDVHDVPSASKPEGGAGAEAEMREKGEAVHESFWRYLRLRLVLEEGMVVTVEPGIYFSPHLLAPVRGSPLIDHEVLARYESVGGVRIEDVVHVTGAGYENLTTVRSEVDWVEGVCSGQI